VSSNAVIDIAEEIDKRQDSETDSDLVTLSNGIVLRTRAVPYKFIIKLNKRFKNPPVPVFYDEEKGRSIPNYSDPQYEADCQALQEEKGMAMLELLTGLGTEFVSAPQGKDSPEDLGWEEEVLPFLDKDETIAESGKARYVAWLNYYALLEASDINKVATKIQSRMGVTEQGAAEAVARFQRDEERGADSRG